eukprot:TRINITY_DN6505_c0_g1_i1.p1 TRINITY_DN6505_c0_g1~~TRINITY_DN6505_c0_g1_i1.p1  ORF type:complete len:245 (-),score=41.85 TRINITY_DN6505_c0_g1_i1:59-793(-)
MKAASINISVLICFGAIMMYAHLFLFYPSQTDELCNGIVWIGHLGFILSLSCLFAKTWRISEIFRNTELGNIPIIHDRDLFMIVLPINAVAIIYLIIWSTVGKPEARVYQADKKEYVSCRLAQSNWTYGVLAGEGLLLLWGTWLSIQVRNVASKFNESKHIGMSIYNIVLVSAVALPVTIVLGKDNPDVEFAVVACAIIMATSMTLGLLFIPKIAECISPKRESKMTSMVGTGSSAVNVSGTQK